MLRRALAVRACLRPALALRPAPLALLARSPLPAFGQPLSTAATGDTEVESLLDQWVGAKRSRNWVMADDLAKELEQLGVNPQEARPDPRRAMREAGPQGPLDAATEAKLESAKEQHTAVTYLGFAHTLLFFDLSTLPSFTKSSSFNTSSRNSFIPGFVISK